MNPTCAWLTRAAGWPGYKSCVPSMGRGAEETWWGGESSVRACLLWGSPVSPPCHRMRGEPSCAPAGGAPAQHGPRMRWCVLRLPRELECHATRTHRCGIRWRQRVCYVCSRGAVAVTRAPPCQCPCAPCRTKQRNQMAFRLPYRRKPIGIFAQHQTASDEARKPAYSSGLPTTPV